MKLQPIRLLSSSISRRLCHTSKVCQTPHLPRRIEDYKHKEGIVMPGNVTPTRSVPESILKPPYLNKLWGLKSWFKSRAPEIKSCEQIKGMRESCALAQCILTEAGKLATVGTTTEEIDAFVHKMCIENNAYPSPLLYRTFPKSVCTSVNNVAAHGIPDDRPLEDGDIINIDVTVYLNGFHGDCSRTFEVGNVAESARKLCVMAEQCRDIAIMKCGPGQPLSIIGNTISDYVADTGFQVIPDLCGHGIGSEFHDNPNILHQGNDVKGLMLPGMTFTIEPVITEGDIGIKVLDDGWTIISEDNSWSAQFEHTILITEHGVEVLTAER